MASKALEIYDFEKRLKAIEERGLMKNSNRIRIEILEKIMSINLKFALVICDNPNDFDTSTIDADHILILPDNGRHSYGHEITKGSYSVSFEPFSL